MIAKILSLLIAIGYVVAAIMDAGPAGLFVAIALTVPLGLIWFPDECGSMTGLVRGGYINHESPPILMSLMGWFLLVGMPAILYLIWK